MAPEPSMWIPVVLSLCVMLAGAVYVAVLYRRSSLKWRDRSQHWFSVAMGEKPLVSEDGAKRIMRDLFANPVKRSELPANTYPGDLPIGRAGAPVYSPLGHPATASTVSDLMPNVVEVDE